MLTASSSLARKRIFTTTGRCCSCTVAVEGQLTSRLLTNIERSANGGKGRQTEAGQSAMHPTKSAMFQPITGWLDKPRLKLSCEKPEESQLNVRKRDELGLRDSTAHVGMQGASIST
jgi:hypothetical protein